MSLIEIIEQCQKERFKGMEWENISEWMYSIGMDTSCVMNVLNTFNNDGSYRRTK